MNGFVRAGIAVLLLSGVAACDQRLTSGPGDDAIPEPEPPVMAYDTSYTVFWNNAFGRSGLADSARIVVRDSAMFADVLRERGISQVPDSWQTDFSRYTVIVAPQGARPSGGYGICVDSVRIRDGQATAYVTRTETPGFSGQAATRPVHIIRTDVRDEPLTFVERTSDVPCQPSWIAQP
jgi:hypothetical protein